MSDNNKLISGGIVFALTSLATYSFHKMLNEKQKQYNSNRRMESIIENYHENITPSNTPNTEPQIQLNETLITYDEIDSPLKQMEDIEKFLTNEENLKLPDITPPTMEIQENQLENPTKSMSTFYELNHTNSITNTEDLEFTKVEFSKSNSNSNIKKNNIYGTPLEEQNTTTGIKLFDKGYYSELEYESDNSDVEHSYHEYHSETDFFKHKTNKKKINITFLKN